MCVRGAVAVPGAAEALAGAVQRGDGLTYMTNNAMRRIEEISALLAGHGFPVPPGSVLSSPDAAVAVLQRDLATGARVLVVGEAALDEAVARAGYLVVARLPADAVVVGNTTRFDYDMLDRASAAVRAGARFVATNTDATYPTSDGLMPGAGSIVAAIATAGGARPVVAGKPERPLADLLADRAAGQQAVLVGDRIETDIGMGRRRRWRTVLVLTGVATIADLESSRVLPDLVADDLATAIEVGPPQRLESADGSAVAGAGRRRWTATVAAGARLRVTGRGPTRTLVAVAARRSAREARVPR